MCVGADVAVQHAGTCKESTTAQLYIMGPTLLDMLPRNRARNNSNFQGHGPVEHQAGPLIYTKSMRCRHSQLAKASIRRNSRRGSPDEKRLQPKQSRLKTREMVAPIKNKSAGRRGQEGKGESEEASDTADSCYSARIVQCSPDPAPETSIR